MFQAGCSKLCFPRLCPAWKGKQLIRRNVLQSPPEQPEPPFYPTARPKDNSQCPCPAHTSPWPVLLLAVQISGDLIQRGSDAEQQLQRAQS